jgi:hypothetical protein
MEYVKYGTVLVITILAELKDKTKNLI